MSSCNFENDLTILQKNSYNDIPLHVFQTYKNDIPLNVKEGMEILRKQNKEFKFYFYNDDNMREFIKINYDKRFYDFTNNRIIFLMDDKK